MGASIGVNAPANPSGCVAVQESPPDSLTRRPLAGLREQPSALALSEVAREREVGGLPGQGWPPGA